MKSKAMCSCCSAQEVSRYLKDISSNERYLETNRLTNAENRLVVAKGEESGGRMDWEFRISRCKLLYKITRPYCIAQGTIFNILGLTIMEKNIKKCIRVYN